LCGNMRLARPPGHRPHASKSHVGQGFAAVLEAAGPIALGCADARKFIRFLAFGLTWCARRPTVTVRNHHHQQTSGQGAKYHAI
jgi:hypothetical protein